MEYRERIASLMEQKTSSSSPEPNVVSLEMNTSMNLSDGSESSEPLSESQKGAYPEPSAVSLKSKSSIAIPPNVSEESLSCEPLYEHDVSSDVLQDSHHESVDDVLQRVRDKHKSIMKNKYESLFEGIKRLENQTLLKRIYTQLYIIEGESEGVNEEHEVLHMEKKPRRTQDLQETSIYCNDIFKPQSHQTHNIKSVLTKGIAGIGKTVSVHKFILDWAEGTANQDVDFIFLLPFRELNLIREHHYSLHKLLLDFHPELVDLDSKIYEECKVVFIFDGLDESRMKLMFSDSQKVSDVTDTSSVAVLMSNLMKGDLLPSALIWITSRPAAANQIPSKYITRVTEIQGFSDNLKEEYFRKRISDEHQANRIMSHIRRARSLHIMCHIPVFCWISSTVLQNILEEEEIPKTLTEMYIHFLLIQMKRKNEKYGPERRPEKEVIVKLAEVAFKQLMKGNVMFYEEDLRECGIDITDASLYSGICTEIFKEESVIHQRKIYSFIHISFQEFLAALFVFYCCFMKKKTEDLKMILGRRYGYYKNRPEKNSLYELLESAVDEAVKRKTGHLDLFLRFLLGISLESNQRLLQDLLTHTHNTSEDIKKITQSIKYEIKNNDHLSADRSINLFLCLSEVNDQTLYREIQEFVRSDKHSEEKLSPGHCSAILYMLQTSEEVIEEFDLKNYNTTQEGRRRLIPAVNNCTRALLARCNLTARCCESLSSYLQSSDSLRELDLSNNDLQDSGVKLISDALKSSTCQLHTLRLSGCNLTVECCESLSSYLQPSETLRELDLSNNDLQDSGVKLISDALKSSTCHLHTLRLSGCNLTVECCPSLSSSLKSSESLSELDLSNNDLQDSGVKLISDALKSSTCHLQTLSLSGCMVTDEGCCYLASALSSNPSHLRELDLSYNHPEHSSLQLFSDRLNDPNYTLNKLNVDHGEERRITAGLHKYDCDLTLDLNTVNTYIKLSEDNRKITGLRDLQSYPDHPDRFNHVYQVLCREILTGRCYWETQWSGSHVHISVSYKSITRKGESHDIVFGYNDKSWSLICSGNKFTARHNKNYTDIFLPSGVCNRVGVYVDCSAGILSFYRISDTHRLTHLHTFNTTFTEPLYAGFYVYQNSSLRFS